MRDRDKKILDGIIGKIFLKFAERLSRFFHHEWRSGQKRLRIVDKPAATPESALFVVIVILSVRRHLIVQNVTLRAYSRTLDFCTDIFRNGNNIIHHLFGIFENVCIHPLKNIIFQFSVAEKIHFIRPVDMPARNFFVRTIFALDSEFSADIFDFYVRQNASLPPFCFLCARRYEKKISVCIFIFMARIYCMYLYVGTSSATYFFISSVSS